MSAESRPSASKVTQRQEGSELRTTSTTQAANLHACPVLSHPPLHVIIPEPARERAGFKARGLGVMVSADGRLATAVPQGSQAEQCPAGFQAPLLTTLVSYDSHL